MLSPMFSPMLSPIDRLQKSMLDGIFDYHKDLGSLQIPIEVFEKEEAWIIKAYAPGLSKEDMHINVKRGNVLYITAVRPKPIDKPYLTEVEYGEMEASVKLGSVSHVKKENIKAEYKDGILYITVTKDPDALPFHVEIE